jgi:hypothetical protein
VKPQQPFDFAVEIPNKQERQHIRKRGNEILTRGNACAPSIWTKKRFKKTV